MRGFEEGPTMMHEYEVELTIRKRFTIETEESDPEAGNSVLSTKLEAARGALKDQKLGELASWRIASSYHYEEVRR